MKKIIYIALLIVFSFGIVKSQNGWTYLTMPTGSLSYDATYSIKFDTLGKVYVGTGYGLNIFDGTNWQHYGYPATFNTCCVTDIALDSIGQIWISTNDGIRIRLLNNSWISYTNLNSGLPLDFTTKISIDNSGNKWIVAANNWSFSHAGLVKYDGSNWTFYDTTNSPLPSNDLKDLKIDQNNNVWTLCGGKLVKFDGAVWTIYDDTNWGVSLTSATSFDIDNLNNVWVGINDGNFNSYIARFDGSNWTVVAAPQFVFLDGIYSLTVDENGNKWMRDLYGYDLWKFDGLNWESFPYPGGSTIGPIAVKNNIVWTAQEMPIPSNYDIYLFNEHGFNSITGICYNDINSDGIRQANEPGMTGIPVHMQPLNVYTLSDTSGYYFGMIDTSGSYSVNSFAPLYWQLTSSPAVYNVIQNSNLEITDSIDFGFHSAGNITDLELNLATGPMRPGFNTSGWITYHNKGTLAESDSIFLTIDTNLTFISAAPLPDVVTNNTLIWSYNNIVPFETRNISILFHVDSNAILGSPVYLSSYIKPFLTDSVPADNFDSLRLIVSASYDPNSKNVEPAGSGINGSVSPFQELEYTINFQNTGTDTAFTVVIKDTLSNHIDLSTFRLIGFSHQLSYTITNNVLIFTFKNILLPDSNTNEAASHGFVKFKIFPKQGLIDGTALYNLGYIFFDYNIPAITNTVVNTIDYSLNINENTSNEANYLFYPNPASSDYIYFPKKINNGSLVHIYNLQGQEMEKIPMKENRIYINQNKIKSGLYLIKIHDTITGKNYFSKIIIE